MSILNTKLTPEGKEKIITNGLDNLITKFALGDTDVNYSCDINVNDLVDLSGKENKSIFFNNQFNLMIYDVTGTPYKRIGDNNKIRTQYQTSEVIGDSNETYKLSRKNDKRYLRMISAPSVESEISEYVDGRYSNTILKDIYQENYQVFEFDNFSDIINGLDLKLEIGKHTLYSAYSSKTDDLDVRVFDVDEDLMSIRPNMCLLFCDDIKKPSQGDSWSTGFKEFKPYSKNNKSTYNYDPKDLTNQDKMVGYVILDKGIVVITEPKLFIKDEVASINTNTEKYSVYNELLCIINRGEFIGSTNPTHTKGDALRISEICFYDDNNTLIAVSKMNKQIILNRMQHYVFSVVLEF